MTRSPAGRLSLSAKKEAVRRHLEDRVPIARLALELGVSEASVRRWVDNTLSHGAPDAAAGHGKDCGCITRWRRANC